MTSSKVSFTIRPPAQSSKLSNHPTDSHRIPTSRSRSFTPHDVDSSDEEGEDGSIEAVTGFDQSGAQRLHEKPKPSGPLVIPALANRDWRAIARFQKNQRFIPDGVAVNTGKDGSQGGLGTRDSINSGPQVAGLVERKKGSVMHQDRLTELMSGYASVVEAETTEENEDERARRALLASVVGGGDEHDITIDAIPVSSNNYTPPADETDAYRQDVVTRPDSATLADYDRVPVSQFGAALLRGMGWKEGTAASRTRRGLVEPWLPTSRPALLGIGAKERPAEDIPSTGKGGFISKRPERRYVPVVKLQREGSEYPPPSRSRSRSPNRSRNVSRVPSSKSASPYPVEQDRDRDELRRHRDRDKVYNTHGQDAAGRRRRDGDSDKDSDRDHRRERGDRQRVSDHNGDHRGEPERGRREKDYRRERGGRY